MTCDFTSFSTISESSQDNKRLIMKVCVQSRWAFGAKMTSYERRCDVITSHRRLYDVILAPNAHWDGTLFRVEKYRLERGSNSGPPDQ